MAEFFNFLFRYNSTIIEVLLPVTFLLVMIWGFRIAFSKPVDAAVATPALADLEDRIVKALDKVSTISPENPKAQADIDNLKKQLEEKSAIVTQLQKEVQESASNATNDLANKIKELEAKLSEYEIIAEDIADLSRYKDQNALLLKEIEQLKSQSSQPAAAKPPPPAEPPVAAATPAPTEPKAQAVTEPPAQVIAEPPAQALPPEEVEKMGAELLNDFQAASKEQDPEANFDLSKMETEAESLKASGEASSEDVKLDEGINNEKLLSEAQELNSGNAPKQEDAQLLNQFENFVKKNEA